MKKLVLLLLISLSTVGVLLAAIAEQPSGDWKKVKDAMDKRRPKTAIEELEPIIQSALQANRYDEATKAIALKIVLEGSIEGNRAEERHQPTAEDLARSTTADAAGDGSNSGQLVLGLFSAKSLAVYAAHANRARRGRGHYDLGPATDFERNRPAFHGGVAIQAGTARHTGLQVQRTAGQRHHARHMPPDDVRFRGLRRVAILQRRRTGRFGGTGRVRSVGGQPDIRRTERFPRLDDPRVRHIFTDSQGAAHLPAAAGISSARR